MEKKSHVFGSRRHLRASLAFQSLFDDEVIPVVAATILDSAYVFSWSVRKLAVEILSGRTKNMTTAHMTVEEPRILSTLNK
jgi:hypothetical protein